VLACGHPTDEQVGMHNCRIETRGEKLRQNGMAYVQM